MRFREYTIILFLGLLLVVVVAIATVPELPVAKTTTQKPKEAEEETRRHTIAIYIKDEEIHDPEDIARQHGFEYGGRIGSLPGYHTVHRSWKDRETPHTLGKDSSGAVEWYEEQVARPRVIREVMPQDPLFRLQWHLHSVSAHYQDTKAEGSPTLPNLNVMDAWNHGVDGSGVTIAVVDDGLERRHPDLVDNYTPTTSIDIRGGGSDPSPSGDDYHGTAVAGTAAAGLNSYCGVGVSPGASLAGIRLLGIWPTDAKEASALSHACTTAGIHARINHIFTNSWGPPDDGRRMEGPGRITRAAMEHCIARGRNGLGSIYVWAGGNGRSNGDNANYDGYANSRYTIAVAAVTERGVFGWYSEPGANILCSAPSSGWQNRDRGITTTDLHGFDGSTSTDCTQHFGGTSAAAPMIAGVVALMLQANPFLGWRDVQHILILSCVITDPLLPHQADAWITNGAGLKHSHAYGFGVVDASDAVRIARTWENVPAEDVLDSGWLVPAAEEAMIPAGGRIAVLNWSTSEDRIVTTMFVEQVELSFTLSAPQGRGYIALTLCSPAGTCSFMARKHGNDRNIEIQGWTYTSVRNWGEVPTGTWYLKVENTAPRNRHNRSPAIVRGWSLKIHGHHR